MLVRAAGLRLEETAGFFAGTDAADFLLAAEGAGFFAGALELAAAKPMALKQTSKPANFEVTMANAFNFVRIP